MAGSLDYFNEDIDGNVNVAIRHRSPGSSIKPFVYAAAFQKGYTPDTVLIDANTDFGQGYIPHNYDLKEHGPVSMRQALDNSLNIPAVKTLYLVGVKTATDLAQRMGMTSLNQPDTYGLSLVLGGGAVRLLDETSAYGIFANDGIRQPARSILKVDDGHTTLLDVTTQQQPGEQVLDPQIARTITDVLADNNSRGMVFGLGSPLQMGSRPVAAKTGTSQDFKDGWTMGYTPSLVTGVWTGNNNNDSMKNNSDGVVTAAPIWNAFMREALAGKPIEQFVKPEPPQNITNQALLGQIPEVKAKWDQATNTVYSLDCPVAIGQPKTFKELHDILFYVRRNDPLGDPPADAQSDPQFDNWEAGAAAWRDKYNDTTKDDPTAPHYGPSLPIPTCDVQNAEDLPKVRITEPNTTILHNSDSPVHITAEVDSPKSIKEVHFLIDGKEIAKFNKDQPYQATFSFPTDFQGRKTLQILAITEDNLIGQAHRTFIINPDDTPPSVQLLNPKDGTSLHPTNFPITVKTAASDSSGIDHVDVLYTKDGKDGVQRIGQTSSVSPTAPNRYEVTWPDSPGPGTYHVYAVAYDKTGNTNQTTPQTITIQ
jgi:membrane carboxypeptidase/penicillin-binding protein PbpC